MNCIICKISCNLLNNRDNSQAPERLPSMICDKRDNTVIVILATATNHLGRLLDEVRRDIRSSNL